MLMWQRMWPQLWKIMWWCLVLFVLMCYCLVLFLVMCYCLVFVSANVVLLGFVFANLVLLGFDLLLVRRCGACASLVCMALLRLFILHCLFPRGLQRGYGATVARLTPDQKVGSSNLSVVTILSSSPCCWCWRRLRLLRAFGCRIVVHTAL